MNNEHRTNYLSREHFFKPIFHRLVLTFHVIHQFSNSFESFPPSVFKLYHGTFFNFSFVIAVLSHLIFSWDWVINDFFFFITFFYSNLASCACYQLPIIITIYNWSFHFFDRRTLSWETCLVFYEHFNHFIPEIQCLVI